MATLETGYVVDPKNPPPYPKPGDDPSNGPLGEPQDTRLLSKGIILKKGKKYTLADEKTVIETLNDIEIFIHEIEADERLKTGDQITYILDTIEFSGQKLLVATEVK